MSAMARTTARRPGGGTGGRRRERMFDVAITGASGTPGQPLLRRLGGQPRVRRITVLGRTHPRELPGKARFLRGDVRDLDAIRQAVKGADVVVHLAYDLYGILPDERRLFETNVVGTRNVAQATLEAGAERFVYTSSAAVYGFRSDNPQPLGEEADVRASARHFYSRHKAQTETIVHELLDGTSVAAYIFRPGAIVGPHAAGALLSRLPEAFGAAGRRLLTSAAQIGLRPPALAPPVAGQYLHDDDVAAALELAVLGAGPPGVYNLAGEGEVHGEEAIALLGFRTLPVPRLLVEFGARTLARTPTPVPATRWFEPFTEPQLLDTRRAREQLGWRPRFDSRAALRATREAIGW